MSEPDKANFLAGGGDMGALTRAYDWASSSIGPPESWPQSLRVTVRLVLNTRHPMLIWWGPDLIQFYNDAYRETMGPERHPSALGARGRECWAEIWDIIGPQIDYVTAGKGSTWDVERLVPVTRHGRLEDVWWTYSYSPIDYEGGVGGVLVVCNDVTAQHNAKIALQDQTLRLETLFENAPSFMAILRGPNHVFELANAAYRRLVGNRDVLGKPVGDVVPEAESQGFIKLLDEAHISGTAHVGRRVPLELISSDGAVKLHYLDFVYAPLIEADGKTSGIFVEGIDVTDHVHAEQQLILINAELKHRVKNTLTVVSAIASQTFRAAADKAPVHAFHDRLAALARAHDLFIRVGWAATPLHDTIETALAPYRSSDGTRFTLTGPPVMIGSKQSLSLALGLHELATNAIKYGALSQPGGSIDIAWSIDSIAGVPTFRFRWQEIGGPPVSTPGKQGFGSVLISRVLKDDFGGSLDVAYEEAGLICRLETAADNLAPSPL
jgi:two-component sensor histidine kinase